MQRLVVDDHLLRDALTGRRLEAKAFGAAGLATTNLWLYRLCLSWAEPDVRAKLSDPVSRLDPALQSAFRARLLTLPEDIEMLPLSELAWPMAELCVRHRAYGRHLSATSAEALAAAWRFRGGIAVSRADVDPSLEAAARTDGIKLHVV